MTVAARSDSFLSDYCGVIEAEFVFRRLTPPNFRRTVRPLEDDLLVLIKPPQWPTRLSRLRAEGTPNLELVVVKTDI